MANEMSPADIKRATQRALRAMDANAREWAVRNTLCELTDFGFWEKGSFVSLDEDMARQVVAAALKAIKYGPDHLVNDIYEVVHHYDTGK